MKLDFDSIYEGAREKHPDLVLLSATAQASLSQQYRNESRADRLTMLVVLSAGLPIAYAVLAVCFTALWRITDVIAFRLAIYDFQQLRRVPGLTEGLLIGSAALLLYFLLVPLLSKLPTASFLPGHSANEQSPLTLFEFNWWHGRFLLVGIAAIYVALLGLLIWYAGFRTPNPAVLRVAFRAWLLPSAIIVGSAPFWFVVGVSLLFQRSRSRRPSSNIQVIARLMEILEDWPDSVTGEQLSEEKRRAIAWKLRTGADAIRRLHFKSKRLDNAEEWAAEQMKLAADSLLVCVSWLYVSQTGTLESVRSRVVTFSNSFLLGQLHTLPRESISEEHGLRTTPRKQRLLRTVWLTFAALIYCLAPLIVYFLIRDRVQSVVLPDSLLLLLYSLWIIVGLYAYLEQTSQNAGATIVEILKGILGR